MLYKNKKNKISRKATKPRKAIKSRKAKKAIKSKKSRKMYGGNILCNAEEYVTNSYRQFIGEPNRDNCPI